MVFEDLARRSPNQWLLHWVRQTPDAVAVVTANSRHSYREMAASVVQFSLALQSQGLRHGMLVGIVCEYSYLHLLLVLACETIGAATLSLTEFEMAAHPALQQRCHLLCLGQGVGKIADRQGVWRLTQDMVDQVTRIAVNSLDVLNIPMKYSNVSSIKRTSGTSGVPKFMPVTFLNKMSKINALDWALNHLSDISDIIVLYNMALNSAATAAFHGICRGKTIRFSSMSRLPMDVEQSIAALVLLFPVSAREAASAAPDQKWSKKAKIIRIFGGSLTASLRTLLLTHCTSQVITVYGISECGSISVSEDDPVGMIVPGVAVRICDDTGGILPLGQTGLIEVQSAQCIAGYVDNPTLTAKHFDDGWFRTFDRGFMPEPGRLMVLGRADDILSIGGIKISPRHLEDQLKTIPGVVDAALLSIPDAWGIEVLHIVIERHDPSLDAALHTQIQRDLDTGVGAFSAIYLPNLPRTETGKIRRNVLKEGIIQSGHRNNSNPPPVIAAPNDARSPKRRTPRKR